MGEYAYGYNFRYFDQQIYLTNSLVHNTSPSTADSQSPWMRMGGRAKERQNVASDCSPKCEPSGRAILFWMWRRPVLSQSALQHLHCLFMRTCFVSVHIKTRASNFLLRPAGSNFALDSVLTTFSSIFS